MGILQSGKVKDEIRQYCIYTTTYNAMMEKNICKEDPRKKLRVPWTRKGPWMSNRRDNRNTRKAKMYRFTQRSFQQNCRVTINSILEGTLSFDNEENVYPDIDKVEKVYVQPLETVEVGDKTAQSDTTPLISDKYGVITTEEVKEALKGIKRDTSAGPDRCCLGGIKDFNYHELATRFNKWWSEGIPEEAVQCRTTLLLPKSLNDRDQVGS